MEKTFRPYNPQQQFLFPRSLDEYVSEDDLSIFIRDLVVEQLDLSEVYGGYVENQGAPPFNPTMMTALLLYAYCQGMYSSRTISRACEQRLDFMVVAAHEHPDFRTIGKFRKRHEKALSGLFEQVLQLCAEAGLVNLGHVALDGTKVRANASKHKAMSYGRMSPEERRIKSKIKEWFAKSEQTDREDEKRYKEGKKDEQLPSWVKNKQEKLERIRQAKEALEKQAQEQVREAEKEALEDSDQDGNNSVQLPPKSQKRKKKGEEHLPHSKDQYNFTDPESSIMPTRGTFEECYNAQAAVDQQAQIIVAQTVTNASFDSGQLEGLIESIEEHFDSLPEEVSADNGYFTEDNLKFLEAKKINGYVAPGREGHLTKGISPATPFKQRMARKIRKAGRRSRYRLRKQIVEPVFGQIKQARKFRQFLRRGISRVQHEWSLVCTAHNLLKLAKANAP